MEEKSWCASLPLCCRGVKDEREEELRFEAWFGSGKARREVHEYLKRH